MACKAGEITVGYCIEGPVLCLKTGACGLDYYDKRAVTSTRCYNPTTGTTGCDGVLIPEQVIGCC